MQEALWKKCFEKRFGMKFARNVSFISWKKATWKKRFVERERTNICWKEGQCHPLHLTYNSHNDGVTDLVLNERSIVSAGYDRRIKWWSPQTMQVTDSVLAHKGWITALSFCGNRTLASSSQDGTVKLWDMESRLQLVAFDQRKWITAMSYNPTDQFLAAGDKDGDLHILDVEQSQKVGRLSGHWEDVTACQWDRTSPLLVTGSNDRTLRCWDLRAPSPLLKTIKHLPAAVSGILPLSSTSIVASTINGQLIKWDLRDWNEKQWSSQFNVTCLAGAQLPGQFFVGCPDGSVRSINAATMEEKYSWKVADCSVTSIVADDWKVVTATAEAMCVLDFRFKPLRDRTQRRIVKLQN
jgi:WD40 repeat protein